MSDIDMDIWSHYKQFTFMVIKSMTLTLLVSLLFEPQEWYSK